jgi:SAM-dependent methyltransferase
VTRDAIAPLRPAGVTMVEYLRIGTPYVAVQPLLAGRRVIDVGGGPGYGSILAGEGTPEWLFTCDFEEHRVARDLPVGHTVASAQMDGQALGVRPDSFDIGLCFEVVEHVPEPSRLFEELVRVLAKDSGLLVMSTPNRRVRLRSFERRPRNPEHIREYDAEQFRHLLDEHFAAFELLGIFGDPDPHEYYRRTWSPTLTSALERTLPPPLAKVVRRGSRTARRVRRRVTHASPARLVPPALPEDQVPAPHAWPFFVAPADAGCLNHVAVCGADRGQVAAAARQVCDWFGRRALPR